MRPLRIKDGTKFQLVTIRTVRGELWLTPSRNVEKLIGGIVARYQEILSVEIYALGFLGNHYHLLVRAPEENLDEFEENVNREIARRLNWKHRRSGKLWSRRYDAQEVQSEEDLLEAFLYVTTNPTRHGLVRDSREWNGLNSFEQSLTGRARKFSFYHYSAEKDENRCTAHWLTLTPLPQFAALTQKQRAQKLLSMLEARMEQIATERKSKGLSFLGTEMIKQQQTGAVPKNVSRSPRPPCYTKCAELRAKFKERIRALRERYTEASLRFRLGDLLVQFPEHTFKPTLHRAPRLTVFNPLTREYLKNFA